MTKIYLLLLTLLAASFISSCGLLGDGGGDGPGVLIGAETLDCTITDDIVLNNHNENGVDYIVDCDLDLRARMTISEGTVIEFREGAGIEVTQGGSIKANGIGGSPIIFRGQDTGVSTWKGIYIFTEQTTSTFDYVEINDAGDGESYAVFGNNTAAITVDGRISFTNSKINNSGGFGLWTSHELNETSITSFSNNIIIGCEEFPLFIETSHLKEMDLASSQFEENGSNMVAFTKNGCEMIEKVTLEKMDVPYFFGFNTPVHEGLKVEAGVQILMGEGAEFRADPLAPAIVMSGTTTNRISIAGGESQAGYWTGMLLRNAANNIFENVDISDGGSTAVGLGDGKANIILEFDTQLTMIDCTSSRSNSSCDVIILDAGGEPTFNDMSTGLLVCDN